MASTNIFTLVDGVHVVAPNSWDMVTPYVLLEQQDWFEDEIKLLRRLLQQGQQVIDIGANYGVYSLTMAKIIGPAGRVWAFEPASSTAAILAEGIACNKYSQVVLEKSALSCTPGVAQLSLNSQPELNSIVQNDLNDVASETVSVVTLDQLMERNGWTSISFMKIDAEGEESNILKGGVKFFAELSPLVQYEVKAGTNWNLELVNEFSALGYDSYRLVPGLDYLVAFDAHEPVDGYLLNLFCCKPDMARLLASEGFLLEPPSLRMQTGSLLSAPFSAFRWKSTKHSWRDRTALLPYGESWAGIWADTMDSGKNPELAEALSAYAISRNTARPNAERFVALQRSFNLLSGLCEGHPVSLHTASLVRVARDFGARSVAVNALQRLIEHILSQNPVLFTEPFLAISERFESIIPTENKVNWLLASALEELERLECFSSFYSGSDSRQRLELISELGFSSAEMKRRLTLLSKRFGDLSD